MTESSSSSSSALLPSSSASFALTLDQNVSRDVRAQVVKLEKRSKRAGVGVVVTALGLVAGAAAAVAVEPVLVALSAYAALFVLPVPVVVWTYARRAAAAAVLLNQDRDVAFVGPQGLVFFSDDGFYVEKAGGWKPYGVNEPERRSFDQVEYFRATRTLILSSVVGYSMSIKVPAGWTDRDTARVRERLDAFNSRR